MSYETPPPVHVPPTAVPVPLPRTQKVDISAGTAFKAGFFGFFGAVCASILVGIVLTVVLVLVGGSFASLFHASV